jgi:ubiquinone biosynthesis protein Coq4
MLATIMALAMSYSGSVYAQDDIREKIEKIKLEKMVKKMELDDATAESFKSKYSSFSKSMKELTKLRAKTYIEMTLNIDGGSGLDSLVDRLLSLESQINQERLDFINDLKSILTSKQIATMIVFERKFNNQLQKLLKEYRNKKNKGIGE